MTPTNAPTADFRLPTMKPLRLVLLALLSVAALRAADKPLTKVSVQLDWIPEPEHGGLYQALARGYFRDEGLDVELRPGGPAAHVKEDLLTGRVDIIQGESI